MTANNRLKGVIWNQPGFDDLKKHSQRNNEFLREMATLIFERAKLEQTYADGLTKIAVKARKICGETIGTIRKSWEEFATQVDLEASLHKTLQGDLIEEITKPLKAFAETQKESRKTAEHLVEKAAKNLAEKRTKECQSKKTAFTKAKECENLTVQLESCRAKKLCEKELTKLEGKCKKAEETVEKSDNDYIAKLVEAERARLDFDSSIESGVITLETLEVDRIAFFKKTLDNFVKCLFDVIPKKNECYKAIETSTNDVNATFDILILVEQWGTPRQPGEQIIFSCYEEDHSNSMDSDRRKHSLEQKRDKLNKTLIGENNAKSGLNRLNSVYHDKPNFGTLESKRNVGYQLEHAKAVIDLLKASIFRVNSALAMLSSNEPPTNYLSSYISARKDKQGMTFCTLRVPSNSSSNDDYIEEDNIYTPPESQNENVCMYEEIHFPGDSDFSDDGEYTEFNEIEDCSVKKDDLCTVDYEYTATENDELSIKPGDVVQVLVRHDDGWWKGELNGRQGLFPASYVHEV